MSEINEPHVAARKRHLLACDDNLCAAILLNEFVYDFGIDGFYEEPLERRTYTHAGIRSNIFSLFSLEEVNQTLLFLMKKSYINATWNDSTLDGVESTPFEERRFTVVVHWQKIEEACEPYYVAIRDQRAKEEAERQARLDEEEANKPPPPPPLSPGEQERLRHMAIRERERERVEQHLNRAKGVSLPATLTIEEWLETLDYYEWKCAYCGGSFELLEHFIPLSHYGGTTRSNCVPACHGCNGVKQSWHPSRIPLSKHTKTKKVRENIEHVQRYLAQFQEEGGTA